MNSNSFWTEARIARLKELRSQSLSHHAIAVRMTEERGLPVTDGMIQSKLRVLAKASAEPRSEGTWTAERVAALKKLWSDGVTAAEIGKQIGMGRYAVIGKKNRLGLPGHGAMVPATRLKPAYPAPPKSVKPAIAGGIAGYNARKINAAKSAKPGRLTTIVAPTVLGKTEYQNEPPRLVDEPLPAPRPAILIDLEPGQCRWPLTQQSGTSGRWVMCGAPQFDGCPYCHRHLRKALTPEGYARMMARDRRKAA